MSALRPLGVQLRKHAVPHAWGVAESGQLGLPATHLHADPSALGETCATPTPIPHLRTYHLRHVSSSGSHSAFVRADGSVFTTGVGAHGQLGHTCGGMSREPTLVQSLPRVRRVACGSRHTLALSEDGCVYAFGDGQRGQLGVMAPRGDDAAAHEVRVLREEGVRVVDIGAGDEFSVAVGEDGRVFTWGFAADGRLGHGERVGAEMSALTRFVTGDLARDEPLPRRVRGLDGVRIRRVFCGKRHVIAVCARGHAFGWGCGRHFQLGTGRSRAEWQPVEAFAGMRVRKVANGATHSLVMDHAGRLFGVGLGEYGCLGGVETRGEIVAIGNVGRVVDVAAGCHVSAVVVARRNESDEIGEVLTWGCGAGGALGNGQFADRWMPFAIGLEARRIIAARDAGCMFTY